jgi:hypothetical protein
MRLEGGAGCEPAAQAAEASEAEKARRVQWERLLGVRSISGAAYTQRHEREVR